MRDPTDKFLADRDVKALRKHLGMEMPLAIADAAMRGRAGLLAVTQERVVWLSRGAVRTRVWEVPRGRGASVRHRRSVHDHYLDVAVPGGGVKAFHLLRRGDEERVLAALGIQTTKAPKAADPEPPQDHKARLDALLASGQMSRAEHEWAMESFEHQRS